VAAFTNTAGCTDAYRMKPTSSQTEREITSRLQWLMFFRVLFTTLLLGSTIYTQWDYNPSLLAKPLLLIYSLIAAIYILTVIYALMLRKICNLRALAYLQIGVDTVIVTMIIFITGSYNSIFSFLYLVVIIYSSLLLFRRGSMLTAALCSIQYGIMLDLEFYGLLSPFGGVNTETLADLGSEQMLYQMVITLIACFAVAFLGSALAEQARKSRRELIAMEDHVKRVQRMAHMGEMAAGLAHEIKNPLASLVGSIQLLKEEGPKDADHIRLMEIVLRETDRLSSLVSNFLMFARPPTAKMEKIRLDQALNETVELFEKDITQRDKVIIEKSLLPGIWVEIDSMHLRQVLWNLLLNAAESIEIEGKIGIEMHSTRNNSVVIRVSDSGAGISDEILESIFDPFFTTKASGTGLGLSIVHRILSSYDSRLDVESQPEEGSCFEFRLAATDPPT
jgi:two-component system sensor histidine kinase PilS (NtrC family)